ncbi:hypothetical protein CPC08DRAFT_703408 [Agrocybe pediades]|nr:hypothetical protein CPC08DRAFT_703408 [Agrocybe pediades]
MWFKPKAVLVLLLFPAVVISIPVSNVRCGQFGGLLFFTMIWTGFHRSCISLCEGPQG